MFHSGEIVKLFRTVVLSLFGTTEDNFSMDRGRGFGTIQAHYIQAHLLLHGLVSNRPRPVRVHGLEVGDPSTQALLKYIPHTITAFSNVRQI